MLPLKYVLVNTPKGPKPLLADRETGILHYQMLGRLPRSAVISAGFCGLDEDGVVVVGGESETLRVGSRREDASLIQGAILAVNMNWPEQKPLDKGEC